MGQWSCRNVTLDEYNPRDFVQSELVGFFLLVVVSHQMKQGSLGAIVI